MAVTPKRTDIKIEEFRKALLNERKRLTELHREQVADIRNEMLDGTENELSHTSTFDSAENQDTALMIAERDREMALDENARQTLHEIDHALDRIETGDYGICEVTGRPIPVDRLRAIPWATMTVEAAAARDK